MPRLGLRGNNSAGGFGNRSAGFKFLEATGGTITTDGDYKVHSTWQCWYS
jgi:hypothetical protein